MTPNGFCWTFFWKKLQPYETNEKSMIFPLNSSILFKHFIAKVFNSFKYIITAYSFSPPRQTLSFQTTKNVQMNTIRSQRQIDQHFCSIWTRNWSWGWLNVRILCPNVSMLIEFFFPNWNRWLDWTCTHWMFHQLLFRTRFPFTQNTKNMCYRKSDVLCEYATLGDCP